MVDSTAERRNTWSSWVLLFVSSGYAPRVHAGQCPARLRCRRVMVVSQNLSVEVLPNPDRSQVGSVLEELLTKNGTHIMGNLAADGSR